jgi:hypothetical protein
MDSQAGEAGDDAVVKAKRSEAGFPARSLKYGCECEHSNSPDAYIVMSSSPTMVVMYATRRAKKRRREAFGVEETGKGGFLARWPRMQVRMRLPNPHRRSSVREAAVLAEPSFSTSCAGRKERGWKGRGMEKEGGREGGKENGNII